MPSSVLSSARVGSKQLLRDGARPMTSAEELDLGQRRERAAVSQALPLEEGERRVLALLTAEPQHVDEIAAAGNVPIAEATALLMVLELKGLIRNAGAQHFART